MLTNPAQGSPSARQCRSWPPGPPGSLGSSWAAAGPPGRSSGSSEPARPASWCAGFRLLSSAHGRLGPFWRPRTGPGSWPWSLRRHALPSSWLVSSGRRIPPDGSRPVESVSLPAGPRRPSWCSSCPRRPGCSWPGSPVGKPDSEQPGAVTEADPDWTCRRQQETRDS